MEKPEQIVRAIVVKDDKILLCNNLEFNYYFLPGGHIEEGESPEQALVREMKEEANRGIVKMLQIARVDNEYKRHSGKIIETFYIYLASLDDYSDVKSTEDHMKLEWVDIHELENIDFKPQQAIPQILESINQNKYFWAL